MSVYPSLPRRTILPGTVETELLDDPDDRRVLEIHRHEVDVEIRVGVQQDQVRTGAILHMTRPELQIERHVCISLVDWTLLTRMAYETAGRLRRSDYARSCTTPQTQGVITPSHCQQSGSAGASPSPGLDSCWQIQFRGI